MRLSILSPSIRPRGLELVQESLAKQTFQDFEWLVEIGIPERGCDLSAAMNRMLKRAKGDIILIYQDYIRIPNDYELERIAKVHSEYPKTFFTYSLGKIKDGVITWDWRNSRKQKRIQNIEPREWEADFASAPKQAFFDIGGYDERFDEGWSWENVNLAQRADKAGYNFMLCPDIKVVAIDHDAEYPHPFRGKNENGNLANNILRNEINQGNWKLNHL